MSVLMRNIMEQIGWSNGFRLPIANDENKALEAELERLTFKKIKASAAFQSTCSRYEALQRHFKHLQQEAEQNQNFFTVCKQQIDTEGDKLKIIETENSILSREIREMKKSIDDIEARRNDKRIFLESNMAKMETMKGNTSLDNDALNEWEEALKKKDEDNELLKKFSKEDERKVKELEIKRQNMQVEVINKRKMVAKMVDDIVNYEKVIQKTGKIFQQQARERLALVSQWQEAVKNLTQRDEEINRTNRNIFLTQEVLDRQKELLDEQNLFLANEQHNNQTVEMEISELNFANSNMRKEYNELVQYILTVTGEVNLYKKTMTSAGRELEIHRMKSRNVKMEISTTNEKIRNICESIEVLKRKMEEVKVSSMSSNDRAKQLENMIEEEQRRESNLRGDVSKTQTLLYRVQTSFQEVNDEGKTKEVEIFGCDIQTKHLEKESKEVLNNLQMQRELLYNLEYKINELEVKLSQLEGNAKQDEETDEMNAKIADLERSLSEHTEVKNFLQSQVTKLADEMRRVTAAISADANSIEAVKGKLQDQVLLCEGGLKQASAAKLKSQQRQVEENVLRLKVSQLRKALSREEKNIYDLQKFRLELETSLKERDIEINTHKEILLAQRKNLDEARRRLRADINRKLIRVEQFQKKYHSALMALGKDEDGRPLSITFIKIQSAQEKYMLQQEGDELDAKVKKAEREIVAMENTLKVVNVTNDVYKTNLSSVDEESEDNQEMKKLENEINITSIILKENKRKLADKQRIIKELRKTFDQILENQQQIKETFQSYVDEWETLQAENEIREERISRAEKQMKAYRKKIPQSQLVKPEKNLEIKHLQEANKFVLQQLADISAREPELALSIKKYTKDHLLELPKQRTQLSINSDSSSCLSIRNCSSASSSGKSALSQVVLNFDNNCVEKP